MRHRVGVLAVTVGMLATAAACGTGRTVNTEAKAGPTPAARTLTAADDGLKKLLVTALSEGAPAGRRVTWTLSDPSADLAVSCASGQAQHEVVAAVPGPTDGGAAVRGYLGAQGWVLGPWQDRPDILRGARMFSATDAATRMLVTDEPTAMARTLLAVAVTPCLPGTPLATPASNPPDRP